MRKCLLLLFFITHLITGSAQGTDSVLKKIVDLRDAFVTQIKSMGFDPVLAAPDILMDNPRSYGNYSADSNILHTSDWKTLDEKSKTRFNETAARIGNGMTGEKYFELSVHQWILVHELGHWWRACRHEIEKPYENEMAANRIAIAFWRERDPGFMSFKLAGYEVYLKTMPSPVPAGQSKVDFLNENYDKLPGGSAYTWFQASMILDGCQENPQPSFRQAIERAGNPK